MTGLDRCAVRQPQGRLVLDLRHASIDSEIHAGDEGTFIGGEKRDGSRDFLWLAPATHWDL
jgi:hypothetical protein